MSVNAYFVFRKMYFPHNGNIITINQLTYYDPRSQTSPQNTISSMVGNKITNIFTDDSPGIYKYSTLIEAYYGPPLVSFEPSSSIVCMLQASRDANKKPIMSSQ